MTPSIHLVAYGDRDPYFVFVKVPNERRYLRTDTSVILVPCPQCGAIVGEPCISNVIASARRHADKRYGATTHADRRNVAARARRQGAEAKPVYRSCSCGGMELQREGS